MNRHPRGPINIAIMPRDEEQLDIIWGQMQKHARWSFTDTLNRKDQFAVNFFNPNVIYLSVLDGTREVGFLSYHPESPWVAVGHALMFDGITRGREKKVRKVNEELMKRCGWALIRTYLPPEHTTSVAWTKRLGFQIDGVMRGTILIGGQPRDLLILTFPARKEQRMELLTGNQIHIKSDLDPVFKAGMKELQRAGIASWWKETAPETQELDSQADAMEHYLSQNGG